jgi:poly(ADP-ribose) glycohydrolase
LPHIGQRAASFQASFPDGLPCIDSPKSAKDEALVVLPRSAVASIVASMFLCALEPPAYVTALGKERGTGKPGDFNTLHFARLLTDKHQAEKIKCVLNYFYRLYEQEKAKTESEGFLAFRRVRMDKSLFDGLSSATALPLLPISVFQNGSIDGVGDKSDPGPPMESARVNFANRYIGGGVLRWGCVQEEVSEVFARRLSGLKAPFEACS